MSEVLWQLVDSSVIDYIKVKAKKGELRQVVCGFQSFFRDDVMDVCSKCKNIIYVRPKIQEIARRYKVPIVCIKCADKKEVAVATVEILEKIKSKLPKAV